MSASTHPSDSPEQKQLMSAMFASLVVQNTNMALVFLGHTANPQSGKKEADLENAKYFIDQLEMLSVKTKGNLDRTEETMLKQSLSTLQLAFVDAVSRAPDSASLPSTENPSTDEQETPSAQTPPEGEPAGEAAPIIPPEGEAESKKKFSKKY